MIALAAIVRVVGLPASLVIGLLLFYEGVPFLRDIPFADRVPVLGQLVAGRVATERAEAAADANRTLVSAVEKAALAAQLAERERQRVIGAIALEDYRKRLVAVQADEQQASQQLETEILKHEKELVAAGRACRVDDADIEWLRRH